MLTESGQSAGKVQAECRQRKKFRDRKSSWYITTFFYSFSKFSFLWSSIIFCLLPGLKNRLENKTSINLAQDYPRLENRTNTGLEKTGLVKTRNKKTKLKTELEIGLRLVRARK